ncbi:MAG: 2-oxoacid:ferredoxin oxidoreductase subunit beta [Candidatus Adiutrix sp.]|jgi:2-oxoglutarate ferredoxin oxidoreductase subunit beta|nr:2-oxoacid:ferredoxin oxidoreductase subunit beta [Candidatus Adiutrix sp.]
MGHTNGLAYLRTDILPNMWCPGCGNGIVLSAMLRAFEALKLEHHEVVAVSGIGCWGKVDDYITVNALHATHGRALSFATGVKAANPRLRVLVLAGDGDGTTIGGNHLIHSARRNMDLTMIMVDNFNYGMTGGQYSATTPGGRVTSTTRGGNPERAFDVCELVRAAGGNYVARQSIAEGALIQKRIEEGLSRPGFSFIEVISACTTLYGPNNGLKTPVDMFRQFKEKCLPKEKYDRIENAAAKGYLTTGVLHQADAPDFLSQYEAMRGRLAAAKGGRA